MKKILAFAISAVALSVSAETTVDWSYAPSYGETVFTGNGVAESHDVAIRISNPSVVGKKITGFSVVVPTTAEVTATTGWLSSRLDTKVESGIRHNDADIVEVDGSLENGVLTVTFAEPYTIPMDGVYVGYSLTIPTKSDVEESKAPVAVVAGSDEEGLFMRSSRKNRYWVNNSAELGMVSAMQVHICGEFLSNSAAFGSFEGMRMLYGQENKLSIPMFNAGDNEISSCEWTYQVAGMSGVGAASFATPVPARLGSKVGVDVPFPAIDEYGTYPATLKITKVNGAANNSSVESTTSNIKVIPFNPVCRPLVEEYTGTWCQYCTRGIAGMEEMNRRYGEDFVGICIHSGDTMQIITEYPAGVYPSGLPGAAINRVKLTDPYYGDGDEEMGIDGVWQKYRQSECNANVYANARWTDESCQTMLIDASAIFIENIENANYRIGCCMVADNLHNALWKQVNAYNGASVDPDMPLYEWTTKGGSVADVNYNDVAVYFPDLNGVEGSVPGSVKAGEVYSHQFEYNVADVLNVRSYWTPVLDEEGEQAYDESGVAIKTPINLAERAGVENLRVVVMLIDRDTNAVVNSCKTGYVEIAGVKGVSVDETSPVIDTVWYDLTGRRVANPAAGIYIRVDMHANGAHTATKQLRK